jgi:hypothetical protein
LRFSSLAWRQVAYGACTHECSRLCGPEHPVQREIEFNGNFGPDSQHRQPGLLANLQEARATKQLLIKRNIVHDPIVGETTCEIKPWILTAPICRCLGRAIHLLSTSLAQRFSIGIPTEHVNQSGIFSHGLSFDGNLRHVVVAHNAAFILQTIDLLDVPTQKFQPNAGANAVAFGDEHHPKTFKGAPYRHSINPRLERNTPAGFQVGQCRHRDSGRVSEG